LKASALVIGDFSPRGGIGIRVEAFYDGAKAKTRRR
jgi:NADPH-dependent 7-cyano-7-deazaguanine reductase QueF